MTVLSNLPPGCSETDSRAPWNIIEWECPGCEGVFELSPRATECPDCGYQTVEDDHELGGAGGH